MQDIQIPIEKAAKRGTLAAMEWTPYLPLPWSRFQLIDGTLSKRGAPVMRRKVAGRWQYRAITQEEAASEFRFGAW
jgi:hypothetical protein